MGEPEFEIQQVFKGGRFPNLAVATDGTVLAIFGKDGVSLKRSEDGGKTWGDPIVIANSGFMGGGVTVDEGTGDISGVYRKEPSAGDADDLPQQGSRKDLGRAGGHRDQARQPGPRAIDAHERPWHHPSPWRQKGPVGAALALVWKTERARGVADALHQRDLQRRRRPELAGERALPRDGHRRSVHRRTLRRDPLLQLARALGQAPEFQLAAARRAARTPARPGATSASSKPYPTASRTAPTAAWGG